MKQSEMILFSPMENNVLRLLETNKVLSIKTIADNHYEGKTPFNGRNTVAGSINKINMKCRYHKLPWFINGTGLGRSGRRVWIEKLSTSKSNKPKTSL